MSRTPVFNHNRIIELHLQCLDVGVIAERIGCSRRTAHAVIQRWRTQKLIAAQQTLAANDNSGGG